MTTGITYFLFIIGFIILIKGADFLVDGASAIARRFNVSDLVIGLTVVAFGTSTPELFVNVVASAKGNTEIAIGNVLGSNISNILLILGVSAVIYPLSVSKGTVWKEIPFSLLAVIVLGLMANDQVIDGTGSSLLTRIDGLVLLGFFAIFLYYSFSIAKAIEGLDEHVSAKAQSVTKSLLLVVAGLIGLTLGGKWIVDGAITFAQSFGMSESLVGLTIVAVGTSLPEMATSAMAAYKKNVGISATIKPLPFQAKSNWDIGVVILASLLLFLSMFTGKKRSLDRWEGIVFLFLYVVYVVYLVIKG